MYKLYLDGWSMMAISKYMGLKYERLTEQILKRRTNCGYITYNGEEYKGKHEPIVSEEVFERTQRMMSERSRTPYGNKSLLSGMLYCGVCGAKMRYQKWGKSGYKIYCYSRDKGKPHLSSGKKCDNGRVWADELEEAVLTDLFNMSGKSNASDDGDVRGASVTELLISQREKLKKKLKNLYSLYGDTADEGLIETIEDVKREIFATEERLSEAEAVKRKLEKSIEARKSLDSIREAWEYMTLKEKQTVLRSLIDRIVITYGKTDIYYKLPMSDNA